MFHLLAFHFESQVLVVGRAEHFHRVGSSGLSAHGEVDGLNVAVFRRLAVDAEDAVTDSQAGFCGGSILYHIGDNYLFANVLQGDIHIA